MNEKRENKWGSEMNLRRKPNLKYNIINYCTGKIRKKKKKEHEKKKKNWLKIFIFHFGDSEEKIFIHKIWGKFFFSSNKNFEVAKKNRKKCMKRPKRLLSASFKKGPSKSLKKVLPKVHS